MKISLKFADLRKKHGNKSNSLGEQKAQENKISFITKTELINLWKQSVNLKGIIV